MPFHQIDQLRYYTFGLLERAGFMHAIFTRWGGVSHPPYDSLNVGSTVGDDLLNVAENRIITFKTIDRDLNSLFDVWQVHSTDVVCTDAPRPPGDPHIKADAILTAAKGVTLFMRFADCVPILLLDPEHQVVGLVHAGWQGTVKKIAQNAILTMQSAYGSFPGRVLAGIGPSICAQHYPVGDEVAAQVKQVFREDGYGFLGDIDGKPHLDLWMANRWILEKAGVTQIELSGICTRCQMEDWYSHRGANGRTGRFGAMIALES
jgi:YfiH family protein